MDLFFHVVYFILENDMKFLFLLLLFLNIFFVKVLFLMTFIYISISLKTSKMYLKINHVLERTDCTIT